MHCNSTTQWAALEQCYINVAVNIRHIRASRLYFHWVAFPFTNMGDRLGFYTQPRYIDKMPVSRVYRRLVARVLCLSRLLDKSMINLTLPKAYFTRRDDINDLRIMAYIISFINTKQWNVRIYPCPHFSIDLVKPWLGPVISHITLKL